MMTELRFLVRCSPAGGYTAENTEEHILVEADSLFDLFAAVRDATTTHINVLGQTMPGVLKLIFFFQSQRHDYSPGLN